MFAPILWTCADPDQSNPRKLAILTEETGEVAREVTEEMIFQDKVKRDPCSVEHIKGKHRAKLREELVQVAAVC
jgi:NTP pyrophosphatase (non-canonical NTP hydrolase)